MRDGYTVQPVNYLFKPVSREELTDVILTARRMNAASQTVAFRSGNSVLVLEISEILYIEVLDHKLFICITSDKKVISGTLAAVKEMLPQGMFTRCHNRFLVNLAYVCELTRGGIKLREGVNVPVSRSCYERAQIDLINFLS